MPRILLSASFSEELLLRQTPGGAGQWGDFQYVSECESEPVDGWVVYDNLRSVQTAVCPPENCLLITGEPESLRRYRSRFTDQFGQIWTSHNSVRHPRVTKRNEAQHWHYGMRSGETHGNPLGFDDLVRLTRPQKTKLVSVLCSDKAHSPDHQQRLRFVEMLKERFGDQVDVFGRGIRPVKDKSDAIYDYKYHIVLENDHSDFFMTEKLADAYLGWSYPIYFGGSEAYFRYPEGSFTAIDIHKPDQALMLIKTVIEGDTYERHLGQIDEARSAVLYKNNIFEMLNEYWRSNLETTASQSVTLLPKNHRAGLVLRQFGRALGIPFAKRAA